MKNEEAIQILKSKMDGKTDTSYEWCECVRLAIKALEQELILDKIRSEIKGWQDDIHDNENDADEHDFVFDRIFEIIDEYTTESENSVTNRQISKIKTEYFVVDDYGYSDKGLVDKVNELIDKVNELTALMQHRAESEG